MNLKGNWGLRIDDKIGKYTARFPRSDQERIRAAFRELAENPFAGNIKKCRVNKMYGGDESALIVFFLRYLQKKELFISSR